MLSGLNAQEATVVGTVSDAKTGETIIGANVFVPGTGTGTITDFDGNYILQCDAGEIALKISFISYAPQEFNIKLKAGEKRELDVRLEEAVTTLEQVEVQAKANRESENLLLMEQKKAEKIQESIGAQELSRKGVSDAADGVKKVTGISMQGSKSLFVRGLGDRYNKTEINGIAMASPNPDKRLLPLDLFPLDVISTIDINKTFTASNFADYSGALINIRTKDYPEDGFINLKVSSGANTQTSFQSFRMPESPNGSHAGFNLNERIASQPDALEGVNEINTTYYFNENPFSTSFAYKDVNAVPDFEFGISGGNSWNPGNGHMLGAVFASSYGKGKSFLTGRDVVLKADGTILKAFDFNEFASTSAFSNLAGLTWRKGDNQLSWNIIYLNNTEDVLIDKNGFDGEGYDLFVRTMMYRDHRLFSSQLIGEHKVNKRISISWDAALSKAKSSEPDRRGVVFEENEAINNEGTAYTHYSLFTLNQGETLRYFSNMLDSTLAASVRFSYDFKNDPNMHIKKKLNGGLQVLSKNRDFNSHVYFYNVDAISDVPAGVAQPENGILQPDPNNIDVTRLINDQAFADSSISIKNNTQNRDSYDAAYNVAAAWLELNYSLTPKLLVNLGLRAELSEQTVVYFDTRPREGTISGLDFFPAVDAKYTVNDKSNLRMALSKTITRAGFLEMAPFRYRPSYGSATTFGNADIQNADNYNADVKYELFPRPGELFTFAAYGKMLRSPIERISLNQGGGTEYTYRNAKRGQVFGLEMEFRKKLLSDLIMGVNASYIYTQIEIDENSSNTFKTHAMQGASPYLINADITWRFWDNDNLESDVSLIYNVFGKRIYAVGDGGKGDVYELPFNSLNAQIKTRIHDQWSISFAVNNILNEEKVFVQDIVARNGDQDYIKTGSAEINRYKTGAWFKLGVAYTFKNEK